jgi:UDPglucose--hexose-1-phosphate uridylyltransferase
MEGLGAHEVIIEDPEGLRLEQLSLEGVSAVVWAWRNRIADLRRDARLRSMFIVRDVGRNAGSRTARGVSQLVAMPMVPPLLKQKLHVAAEFLKAKERSLFAAILDDERKAAKRIVYENSGFVAFCPYASRVPFELALWPKREWGWFEEISDLEMTQFAEALRHLLQQLAFALDSPAYHLMLTTAPVRSRGTGESVQFEGFRWHVEILPRLQPVHAFELATGCYTNSVWPEEAAAFLRSDAEQAAKAADQKGTASSPSRTSTPNKDQRE